MNSDSNTGNISSDCINDNYINKNYPNNSNSSGDNRIVTLSDNDKPMSNKIVKSKETKDNLIIDMETSSSTNNSFIKRTLSRACSYDSVTDEELLDAQRMLARMEGIFVEPASATGIAGLLKSNDNGQIPPGTTVVVTVTGHGLKDPEIAVENSKVKSVVINPDISSVLNTLEIT